MRIAPKKYVSNSISSNDYEINCNSNTWNFSQDNEIATPNICSKSKILSSVNKDDQEIKVKCSLQEWLDFVESSALSLNQAKYSIEKAQYIANVQEFNVSVQCSFDIFVFLPQQRVPLVPNSVAIKSSSIHFTEHIHNEPTKVDDESCIGNYKDAHTLFCEKSGRYHIKLDILVNFLTIKKNGVGFATPKATFNHIRITVPKNCEISIVEPAIKEKNLVHEEIDSVIYSTKSCSFPPISYLKIQWTDLEVSNDKPSSSSNNNNDFGIDLSSSAGSGKQMKQTTTSTKVNEQTKINVNQNTVFSVGEDVVVIYNSMKYEVVSGSVSSFEISLHSSIKVLSVDGSRIKKWECIPVLPLVNLTDVPTPRANEQIVKVLLESSVEDSFTLMLTGEIETATSGEIEFHSIKCKGLEITREKGFLVVESTSNVEVEQMYRDKLTLIDKTELPRELVSMTSGPLLLSYKFLDPNYKLNIRVNKPNDLGVLVAFCECAHFIATCSSEGALLYKLVFRIRNTQQQYIRIAIPHRFDIWSTIVASKAVKPAVDENNSLMIPLNKSGGEKGIQKSFDVEIVYKHQKDFEFHNQGELDLVFPQIDIPISTLLVSLYLPKDYKYNLFTGNIKEVSYFSKQPPTTEENQMPQANFEINQFNSNVMPQMAQMAKPKPVIYLGGGGGGGGGINDDTSGLKPVKVNIPTFGVHIKLEQLLVISTQINISTKYYTKRKCYCC